MSELFKPEMVAGDSPRLKWIKRHQLDVWFLAETGIEDDSPCWVCQHKRGNEVVECGASGPTEDDALADWARRNRVKLWNEE